MRKLVIVATALIVLLVGFLAMRPPGQERGEGRFFADTTYNFEAVRALNDVAPAGGDSADVQRAVSEIKPGDAESWFRAWFAAGERALGVAAKAQDSHSKGDALLRAHTYFRSAEFFLAPDDPRRPATWQKNVTAFYQGLDARGVRYERIRVPYGRYHLNAVYYPGGAGAAARPLIMVVNGYDGTMEELYVSIVATALERGYSVLTYEGPGQGAVLREQGLRMQADWEKPNAAVLDQFLSTHDKPAKIVLIGESLGGYLAPRAAAFDQRIDGVVAFDIWYDGYEIATRNAPRFLFWLHAHGYDTLIDRLMQHADSGAKWAVQNGEWVFGVTGPFGVFDAFKSYRIGPVAERITKDVLLLAGADDHFVPITQLEPERRSLTHARSVSVVVFDRDSGGAEHCQIGAPSLWQAAFFDWLEAKFPAATR
jgi:alpha-beta hydrolase superfamily lysophospholipase